MPASSCLATDGFYSTLGQRAVVQTMLGSGPHSQSHKELLRSIENGTAAILALSDRYLYWPDANERRKIAYKINVLYNFPHCVAIADGTLFPLAFEPKTMDAPDYSGRKYGYSLSTLIVCDHIRAVSRANPIVFHLEVDEHKGS